jgi:hypothetical protein
MRRLYFEISQALGQKDVVLVLRARTASATFFHGTADDLLTAESALEDMGLITYAELIRLGFISQSDIAVWHGAPNAHAQRRQRIAKALDQLSDEKQEALTELLLAKKAGFDTKFLQDLDEVK